MKVLLIKPPHRGFVHQVQREVPIGLGYLAASLRQAGHDVSLFDSLAYRQDNHVVDEVVAPVEQQKIANHPRFRRLVHWGASWTRIRDAIVREAPDVIGITCMFSCYYLSAYEVARIARQLRKDVKIVMGGSHVTSLPEHALGEKAIDVVALGEGEQTAVELMEALQHQQPLTAMTGVAFRCGEGLCDCAEPVPGRPHIQPRREWLMDLDQLPTPAADLFNLDTYGPRATLITSRGCPFSCTFCSVHATVGKKFRARSPAKVVDEIAWYIEKFGTEKFYIEDDNFTFDMDRVEEICHELLRRKVKASFFLPNGITALKINERIVSLMVQAGFSGLFFGLESTDPAVLKKIQKGFVSLDKVNDGVAAFRKYGIRASCSLIIGLVGQRPLHVAQDVLKLSRRGIKAGANPFYPVPGSPDFRTALSDGTITPQTDPALLEGSACHPTTSMTGREMYWTWIATDACNRFDDLIRLGRERARAGRQLDPVEAIRLVQLKTELEGIFGAVTFSYAQKTSETRRAHDSQSLTARVRAGVEKRTLWLKRAVRWLPLKLDFELRKRRWLEGSDARAPDVEGKTVRFMMESCICGSQHLVRKGRSDGERGLCYMTADVAVIAASLATQRPLSCEETRCRLVDDADYCEFTLREGSPEPVVTDAFALAWDGPEAVSGAPASAPDVVSGA